MVNPRGGCGGTSPVPMASGPIGSATSATVDDAPEGEGSGFGVGVLGDGFPGAAEGQSGMESGGGLLGSTDTTRVIIGWRGE
jgi:hypothetical protein